MLTVAGPKVGPPPAPSIGLDVGLIRRDFPLLAQSMRGKPLIYLDSSATSLKPRPVIDAVATYYSHNGATIHRGVYELSERATADFEASRRKVAGFIGAPPESHIIFTKGATESLNLIAYGLADNLRPGDEIVLTEMEHHANFVPWQHIAQSRGARLRFIPLDARRATLQLEELDQIIGPRTRLVAITAMSNVTGWRPPLEPIIAAARRVGALSVVDAAQLVSHGPVDVAALGCDFLAFSAHKMLGPTGLGMLYGRAEALEQLTPFLYGGDMINRVSIEQTTFKPLPGRFEAGTPNIAAIIGMGAAIDYLERVGMGAIQRHEQELFTYALERLGAVKDVIIYGPHDPDQQAGIVSFNFDGVHSHDVGTVLNDEGIAIRAGHHCAQPFMRRLGTIGTARASFYLYNTRAEIDRLAEALERVRGIFR